MFRPIMKHDSKTSDIVTCMHVSSGIHAGSSVVMSETSAVVGGDTEADVVLLDEGIAAQHVRLEQKNALLVIQALAPGVVVNGEALSVDTICDAYFPVLLDIGPVSIRIVGPPPPTPAVVHAFSIVAPKALRRPMASHAIILLMALTGAGLVGYPLSGWWVGSSPVQTASTPEPATKIVQSSLNIALPFQEVPLTSPTMKPEMAADIIRKSIAAAVLPNLAVSVAEGHVEVSGVLTPEEQNKWQMIQKSFDEQYTGQVLLIDSVSIAAVPPAPRLGFEAVSLGKDPYVVVAGRRHKTGSVIDGWEITTIERNHITIRRGTQSVSLAY
jgi:type III secretion protein D